MTDSRRFLPLLGAAAALMLIHQGADLTMQLPGTDFATPTGRVRMLLAFEARTPAVLVADLLLIWALVAGRFDLGLRAAAVLHFLFGALLVVAAPMFLLDAGRLANGFSGYEAVAFRVVVARTLVVLVTLGVVAGLAGRALFALYEESGAAPSAADPAPVP